MEYSRLPYQELVDLYNNSKETSVRSYIKKTAENKHLKQFHEPDFIRRTGPRQTYANLVDKYNKKSFNRRSIYKFIANRDFSDEFKEEDFSNVRKKKRDLLNKTYDELVELIKAPGQSIVNKSHIRQFAREYFPKIYKKHEFFSENPFLTYSYKQLSETYNDPAHKKRRKYIKDISQNLYPDIFNKKDFPPLTLICLTEEEKMAVKLLIGIGIHEHTPSEIRKVLHIKSVKGIFSSIQDKINYQNPRPI